MKIVLDSCIVLQVAFTRKPLRIVWDNFLEENYTLCVTDEILYEYEEKIAQLTGNRDVAQTVINIILNANNVERVNVFYHYGLIKADADDNKFVDCAITANARYVVTEDTHFNELKHIEFPKVDVINMSDFVEILKNMDDVGRHK